MTMTQHVLWHVEEHDDTEDAVACFDSYDDTPDVVNEKQRRAFDKAVKMTGDDNALNYYWKRLD